MKTLKMPKLPLWYLDGLDRATNALQLSYQLNEQGLKERALLLRGEAISLANDMVLRLRAKCPETNGLIVMLWHAKHVNPTRHSSSRDHKDGV